MFFFFCLFGKHPSLLYIFFSILCQMQTRRWQKRKNFSLGKNVFCHVMELFCCFLFLFMYRNFHFTKIKFTCDLTGWKSETLSYWQDMHLKYAFVMLCLLFFCRYQYMSLVFFVVKMLLLCTGSENSSGMEIKVFDFKMSSNHNLIHNVLDPLQLK